MNEAPRETWAMYIGIFATIIPALIASNFMPDWNVLPFLGWLTIAAIGAALAGAIATPYWFRGMLSGALAGAGALFGLWLYVQLRVWITGIHTFFKLELVIGAVIGAGPGLLLYGAWARYKPQPTAIHDALGGAPLDDEWPPKSSHGQLI